jgi:cell wall-associated NlpC family hydrolase
MRARTLIRSLLAVAGVSSLLLVTLLSAAALTPQQTTAPSTTILGEAASLRIHRGAYAPRPLASIVVDAAKSQVGGRYRDYGDTPATGFSCVGLVHWAYLQAGLNVPESENGLFATLPHVAGATPTGAHLLPGDILLYHDTGFAGLSHASIYVGGGLMVSADSPAQGIRLEPIATSYWIAHWSGAVRSSQLIQDLA